MDIAFGIAVAGNYVAEAVGDQGRTIEVLANKHMHPGVYYCI